uniref:Protein disulfide-isomerase A6 n=1 Tax=Tetraselmis sp. GSL018 TaxID=582737 RepID=A0A061S777_9CHLO|mmetsp:Transcript_20104/g.47870  ORF Transcript_20104/g.47870 Transcript_20104/m.47870 type:complete len:141 (+) Transcript_20104:104-526(+)
MNIVARISILFVSLALCQGGEFDHANVEKYTAANFKDKVSDGKVHFVKFFAPWCGHCKRLGPTWGQLGDEFSNHALISVATVDCTAHKSVCTDVGVRGYPTLKVFGNGQEYKTFQGSRDLSSLKSFVEKAAKELTTETTE